jgi:hypothetical protein
MNGCRSATARRREHAAAVVCAIGLFVALVAGSALRPHYTANAFPEPAGWAHAVQHVRPDVAKTQPGSSTSSADYLTASGNPRSTPMSRKPFTYVWMTHDLPSSWPPLSPQLDWSALPASFSAVKFKPRGAPWAASAVDAVNRHTSTLLCIIRC